MRGYTDWSQLPVVLTTRQVQTVLQASDRTVLDMLRRGVIRGEKIMGEWRVPKSALIELFERRNLC